MIDNTNGNVVASYEYSPFGKLFSESETISQPFKFSSEYADTETNLVYYNYRYYNPELGRWLKRDPIQENGGYNIYGFVNNNPIIYFDLYGLRCCNKSEMAECTAAAVKAINCGAKLLATILKYKPAEDVGGHSFMGGTKITKPGGHYKKINNYKACVKNNLKITQKCSDCDNFKKPPKIPRKVDEIANRPVQKPNIPSGVRVTNGDVVANVGATGLVVVGLILLKKAIGGGLLFTPAAPVGVVLIATP